MNRRKLFAAAATAVLGILLVAGAQKEYVQTDHVQVADGKANSTVTLDRIVQLMDENVNRERLVKDSQIRALQNQINAHFIYNVLESVPWDLRCVTGGIQG